MNVILIAVIILGVVGLVASIMLYAASKKFAVVEDERIGQVAEVLPQANCGGCGYPGCAGFAAACVKAADGGSIEGKLCPVGGQPVMEKVAGILGLAAAASTPKVAVVRCNGTCQSATCGGLRRSAQLPCAAVGGHRRDGMRIRLLGRW